MAISSLRIPTLTPVRPVSIWVDDREVQAFEGEPLLAALTAGGFKTLRRTRNGQPRGYFCGMGVCYECLVTIDGRPGQRACGTRVTAGMRVELDAE